MKAENRTIVFDNKLEMLEYTQAALDHFREKWSKSNIGNKDHKDTFEAFMSCLQAYTDVLHS